MEISWNFVSPKKWEPCEYSVTISRLLNEVVFYETYFIFKFTFVQNNIKKYKHSRCFPLTKLYICTFVHSNGYSALAIGRSTESEVVCEHLMPRILLPKQCSFHGTEE